MTGAGDGDASGILRYSHSVNHAIIPVISLALVTLSFLLQGHIDISLQDEGFLWYGAFRTGLGEIPMRDFMGYDPGRYYWIALWAKILGNGLMPLRMSVAVFQFLGLTCGLYAASRVVGNRLLLTITGLVLLLWMYPRHKLFEPSIAMTLIYAGVLLLERPTIKQHFLSGLFVGMAAFFGRNHGLYGLLGFVLIISFARYKCHEADLVRKLAAFFGGILVGYLPMIVMIIAVDGFAVAMWESIRFLMELGSTNIPLPVPWPWLVSIGQQGMIRQLITGVLFLCLPAFFFGSLCYVLTIDRERVRGSALFISSVVFGSMYMHFAFSRPDINHLAQGLHPFLLGMISLPLYKSNYQDMFRKSIVFILLVASLFSVGLVSPFYKWISNPGSYVKLTIDGDELLVKKDTAQIITTIENINRDLVKEGEQLLIAPHWPMLYPILKRKCPLWEAYFLHQRPIAMQRDMINQLKMQNTNWIVLGDVPLDGRDELRFRNTHRLLWEYFNQEYEVRQASGLPTNYVLLNKKR